MSLPVVRDEPLAPAPPAVAVTAAAKPAPRTPPSTLALLLAFAALLLALQGARGLWDPDEGRYSAVAWNMVSTGDWFTPHLSLEVPHFTKPPLTYWALAASMKLLGRNETALRLPGALAAILTVLLVYALGKRLVPADPLLAATVQATALLPFVGAHLVTTDPLLALFETLAVFGFVAGWWDEPAASGRTTRLPGRWAMPVMWLGFGLAFLTKGPPGLLPLLPIVVFAAWTRRGRGLLHLLSPVGIALFALTAFSWYALQMRLRPDLLGYLLGFEVGGRLVGAQSRNPGWNGLLVAIVPVVIGGLLPWSAAAVFVRRRRDVATPRAPRAGRFLWSWALLPLLVFCVVQSRQPLYLLPLAAPGSLLVARRLAPAWTWSRRQRGWLAVWAVALLAIAALGAFRPEERDGRRFTAAVLRLADGRRPSALIFVDRHARYSATMYCRCEVESVQLLEDLVERAGPAYRPITETLAEELAHRERGHVWLIRPLSHAAWLQAMAQAGWRVRRLGTVEDYPVYAAEPPPRPSAGAG